MAIEISDMDREVLGIPENDSVQVEYRVTNTNNCLAIGLISENRRGKYDVYVAHNTMHFPHGCFSSEHVDLGTAVSNLEGVFGALLVHREGFRELPRKAGWLEEYRVK